MATRQLCNGRCDGFEHHAAVVQAPVVDRRLSDNLFSAPGVQCGFGLGSGGA